jgi:(p)ppGpp synthase/HD superfamily hydrolase
VARKILWLACFQSRRGDDSLDLDAPSGAEGASLLMRRAAAIIGSGESNRSKTMTVLTDRFSRAVDYARIAHAAQVRKGSDIPYIYHLLGVSSLVIEFGGDEDQAIAGLLHDTIEDCGAAHEAMIRAQFGDAVANIVVDCTDGTAEGKASHTDPEARRRDWSERKLAYLAHLKAAPEPTLLVSACDKLHNARAIVQDLENPELGTRVFDRFTGGRDGTLGYYQALAEIFTARGVNAARVLDNTVDWMHELAGAGERKALAG